MGPSVHPYGCSEGEHCVQVVLPTHGAEPCQDHPHPDSVHAVDWRSALCPRISCTDFRRSVTSGSLFLQSLCSAVHGTEAYTSGTR